MHYPVLRTRTAQTGGHDDVTCVVAATSILTQLRVLQCGQVTVTPFQDRFPQNARSQPRHLWGSVYSPVRAVDAVTAIFSSPFFAQGERA
jgi:hypothetical protein